MQVANGSESPLGGWSESRKIFARFCQTTSGKAYAHDNEQNAKGAP